MKKGYHVVRKEEAEKLTKFLVKNGQALLPMVELIEQSKLALDELIDVLESMARLEKQAECLEREYPSAAGSLREG